MITKLPISRLVGASLAMSVMLLGCDSGSAGDADGAASSSAMQDMGNHPADASGPQVPDGVAQFAVDPFWPQPMPNNWILGQVAGTDVDSNDNVWVIHRPWTAQGTNAGSTTQRSTRDQTWGHDPLQSLCCETAPPVVAFDPDGNVIHAWGGDSPTGEYQWFNSEHGIHVDHNNNVWVAGNGADDHHMMKFTVDGEFIFQIGGVGANGVNPNSNDPNSVRGAAQMEVDPETNEVYVADGYGNRRMVVFDAETGEYRRHWGAYGETPVDENPGPWDPKCAPEPNVSHTRSWCCNFQRRPRLRDGPPQQPDSGLPERRHLCDRVGSGARHIRAGIHVGSSVGPARHGAEIHLRTGRDEQQGVDAGSRHRGGRVLLGAWENPGRTVRLAALHGL